MLGVRRARRPSELLSLALSLLACVAFVLGLRDAGERDVGGPNPTPRKIAEPIPVATRDRTASVRVTVVREGGAALAQATVQVFWENGGKFYWAGAGSTNALGVAVLPELPSGRAWVLGEAPGFARSSSATVLGADQRAVQLVLHAAQTLDITVQDDTSAPIVRATVLVDTADPLPFGALSGELGVAHFKRLSRAPWSIKVSAPGFESISRQGLTANSTVTLRRLATVEVVVYAPDGQPSKGATVMIAGPTLWPARSAETDAHGLTRIAGLLAGSYDLRATRGDFVSPTLLGFELARGANERVALRLTLGRTVVALVTETEENNPVVVANADVVLAESGVSSFPIRGRTGTDGTVLLGPIAAGPATLGARAEGFVGSALVPVPDTLTGPVRVPLLRGATLVGHVEDARGFAIEDASIEVVGVDASGLPIAETPALVGFRQNHFAWALPGPVPLIAAGELGVIPGPVPPIPGPLDHGQPANAADFVQTPLQIPPWVTNRGGDFSARPVTPGRVRAIVRHPDYVEATSDFVVLAPGGEARVTIVLLRGGTLEGRVLDEHAQPVAGVEVELSSPRASRSEHATTESDGTFAFAAVPSEVSLSLARATDVSRAVARKTVSVAEGAHERVLFVLPAERPAVRVLAIDEDDRALEMVEIQATSLDPARPMRLTRFTDAEGTVSIDDALGENLRLIAEAPGYARAVSVLEAAPKELTLTLKRGVLVEGRVTSVRGRRTVAGALVSLQQDGVRKVTTSDAEGVFRLANIAPGEVKLHVEHSDFADEDATAQVSSTGRADRPFSLPDVDLSEPSEVEGEVSDERGDRVAGAWISTNELPSFGPSGKTPRGTVLSDRGGHFLLSVHPGAAVISALSSVAGRGSLKIEVSSGHSVRGLRIVLSSRAEQSPEVGSGGVAITLAVRTSAAGLAPVVVSASGDAERAGVQASDTLIAIDGVKVSSIADARRKLSGRVGSDLVLELSRGGTPLKVRVLRE
jgi:hypothetical protein